jgi:hypothetical protein
MCRRQKTIRLQCANEHKLITQMKPLIELVIALGLNKCCVVYISGLSVIRALNAFGYKRLYVILWRHL